MIDTMIFDRLVDEPAALDAVRAAVRGSRLALFTTPVQESQVAAVPDRRRRKLLQTVPREVVPPSGDGAWETLRAVAAGRAKHFADGVIAETALARCDLLVTEDARLRDRSLARGLEVWDAERLLTWVAEG